MVYCSLASVTEQLTLPSIQDFMSDADGTSVQPTAGARGNAAGDGSQYNTLLRMDTAKPVRPQPLCDSRLKDLTISTWTCIPISDGYAACVISRYLATDHPVLGFFDSDLFVRDLVSGRTDFCSPLLVASVLYWGCVSMTT